MRPAGSPPYQKLLLMPYMVRSILSRSAQFNAENISFIESAALAETYSFYIDRMMQKYASRPAV